MQRQGRAIRKSCNAAPRARNMKARGKREARRPWIYSYASFRPEGPKYNAWYYALSEYVGKVPALDSLTQIKVKLSDALPTGDVWLSISLRGQPSNKVGVRIPIALSLLKEFLCGPLRISAFSALRAFSTQRYAESRRDQ